jgi:hypothetical protein
VTLLPPSTLVMLLDSLPQLLHTHPIVSGFLGCISLYLLIANLRPKGPLPPGPRGLPLIGNALDMPKDYEWIHWAKHKDIYGVFIIHKPTPYPHAYSSKGPISSVKALGTRVIIINDLQTAIDLLDTRSSIYSNRPVFPFAGEMYRPLVPNPLYSFLIHVPTQDWMESANDPLSI